MPERVIGVNADAFHRLHQSGCFVIPNPWDVGSARLLASLGFKALATSSAGFAWSMGRRDQEVSLDDALGHLRAIAGGVDLPVNADFEDAFATEPADVAVNVTSAVATGIAGLSVEDSTGDRDQPLFEKRLAVERISAARAAIDASRTRVLLTARSEGFIAGRPDLKGTIDRLVAYAAAGADCLFAPGLKTRDDISSLVRAVAPTPVNVLALGDFIPVAELADLGVRRISVGGALARTAWTGFMAAAREIADHGTFGALGRAISTPDMNHLFEAEGRHHR